MTPRSFFTILIKLLGVYFLWQAVTITLSIISTLGVSATSDGNEVLLYVAILTSVCIAVLIVVALKLCLNRPDIIIDKLALDKGFSEDRFDVNIHRSTVLSIAVIVTGALIVTDSFPILCMQLLSYIQEVSVKGSANKGYVIMYVVKLIIGYLLLSNNRRVVALIEQKRRTE